MIYRECKSVRFYRDGALAHTVDIAALAAPICV